MANYAGGNIGASRPFLSHDDENHDSSRLRAHDDSDRVVCTGAARARDTACTNRAEQSRSRNELRPH